MVVDYVKINLCDDSRDSCKKCANANVVIYTVPREYTS